MSFIMSNQGLALFKKLVASADMQTLRYMNKVISRRLNSEVNYVKSEVSGGPKPKPRITSPKVAFGMLLDSDWSNLFSTYDDICIDYYVYVHIDPRSNTLKLRYSNKLYAFKKPFYVGMGKGERVFNKSRSVMHTKTINDLTDLGYAESDFMLIFTDGMTEAAAREMEAKLILFFGIKTAFGISNNSANKKTLSGQRPSLFNHRYEPIQEGWEEYAH